MVSRAFQILSDSEKKEKYDRFGGDPDSRFGPGSAPTASPFSGFARSPGGRGPMFDDEISPEELFNRFFGGGGMGGPFGTANQCALCCLFTDKDRRRRRRHVRHRPSIRLQHGRRPWLQSTSVRRRTTTAKTNRSQWTERPAAVPAQCFDKPPPSPHSFRTTAPFFALLFPSYRSLNTFHTRPSEYYAALILPVQCRVLSQPE